MSDEERGLLETEVRLRLRRQFLGTVSLVKVLGTGSCLLEHDNGMRGVVPIDMVVDGVAIA